MQVPPLLPMPRLLAALGMLFLVAHASSAQDKPAKVDEAVRLRVLIVADTDAKEGAACGLDASNLKAVLEAGLKKQKLEGRYTIDTVTGRDVSPAHVLKYYKDLKVGTNDALVFYYSGHGAYHTKKGHLLTFNQGDLPRASVLAAMQKHRPRLTVVLTDCCAIYDDIPLPKPNAPAAAVGPISLPKLPGLPAVPGLPRIRGLDAATDPPPPGPASPPRPKDYLPPSLAGSVPPAEVPHPPRPENYRPPPPLDLGPDDYTPGADGVVLRTADGPLPLKTLVEQTDGELMRSLFYRHTGVVDINGCEKGKAAYATVRWGGGLFTIGFLSLQKDKAVRFDTNKNGLAEWSEFFPNLQSSCERACTVNSKGQIRQVPEATRLAQPSLPAAAK